MFVANQFLTTNTSSYKINDNFEELLLALKIQSTKQMLRMMLLLNRHYNN
uniref:Uncharacterized protein n=1 Tax=Meloidogyne enterolobii TaxID=390850 RepID=A0A6V7VK89_MELEN|nr:unnamed protein product [Meloidogyne enterolobii]